MADNQRDQQQGAPRQGAGGQQHKQGQGGQRPDQGSNPADRDRTQAKDQGERDASQSGEQQRDRQQGGDR